MNSFESAVSRLLRQKIAERKNDVVGRLTMRLAPDEYQYQCGYVKALSDVEDEMSDVEKLVMTGM